MRCGNDPRARLTPGDRAAVEEFRAFLDERAGARAAELGEHAWELLSEDPVIGLEYRRCTACGVTATRRRDQAARQGVAEWTDWLAPDGRTWWTTPGGDEEPPSCPLPGVEALCPWEDGAERYAGAKGDVQLDTGMRTWCETHQLAVSECPEPGPHCPGWMAHEDGEPGRPGPCTGRENTCRCMCPPCCGDTPDMYGYDGDY
ncbi:hypothetical protein [Streptomyces scabiei]|uniref:hypothetical protein n=1 Tax=Streptomyces scabiei TaxID=1930 RepID=UPI0029B475D7|nr:hypothetical protein [Streptomyces scabiei]MDX3126565.1 hypothetical protein [Streptomyces scabiei]MDX3203024.1 hypothetical protein [Streptomyces scabiei]MDX3223147.1 hypothetical protein [Streptomyces scabiei]